MSEHGKPTKRNSLPIVLLIVAAAVGIGYAIGRNREISKRDSIVEKIAGEKKRLRESRDQLKGELKSLRRENKGNARGKGNFANLVTSVSLEVPGPLPYSPDFAHARTESRRWVCIDPWNETSFFCCDYADLFLFDAEKPGFQQFPKPEIEGLWNPTGVACVPEENLILLANYLGNNLFEFRVDAEAGTLTPIHEYRTDGMLSPEGIALSADGNFVAAADYDGNGLWVFNRRGKLAWKRDVGLAHGVSFGENSVYVTSLRDKKIFRYSLTGELLAETGGPGYGANEYMWPTSVSADPEGVIISDALTGKVTLLDQSLKYESDFGGNGAAVGLFSMPYFTIRHEGKFWVCDTFKERLLTVDPSTGIEHIFSNDPPIPADRVVPSTPTSRWEFTDLGGSIPVEAPQFPSGLLFPNYGKVILFEPQSAAWREFYTHSPATSLFYPKMYSYFTWIHRVTVDDLRFVVIGSVSHPAFYVIHPDGRGSVENTEGDSTLRKEGDLIYRRDGTPFDMAAAVAAAKVKFDRHSDLLSAPDADAVEATRITFWPDIDAEDFLSKMTAEFESDFGKAFWSSFSKATTAESKAAAAAAFDKAANDTGSSLRLAEYWLRNLLIPTGSGSAP